MNKRYNKLIGGELPARPATLAGDVKEGYDKWLARRLASGKSTSTIATFRYGRKK